MKTKGLTGLIAGLASVFGVNAGDVPVQVEKPAYEVRGYFKMLDADGNEVRHLTPGQTNILQLRAQIPQKLEKPVIGVNFDIAYPESIFDLSTLGVVPFEEGTYYDNDFFAQGGSLPVYELDPRHNKVSLTGGGRSTKFVTENRLGPVEGEGNLEKILLTTKATNVMTGVINLSRFGAAEAGSFQKPVRTRAFRVAVVPQDYTGRHLIADVNDGEEPANDFTSLNPFGQTVNYVKDGRVLVPEPFMIGTGVLYRSTEGAAGPWTAVYTNSAPAASFSDREMKGKNAFYWFGELDAASAAKAASVKKGQ